MMRLRTFEGRPRQDAKATLAVNDTRTSNQIVDPLPATNSAETAALLPRITVLESFNGDQFATDSVIGFVNQAVDVLELWDRSWFGDPGCMERQSSVGDVSSSNSHHQHFPPFTNHRRRSNHRSGSRVQAERLEDHAAMQIPKPIVPWNDQAPSSSLSASIPIKITPERQAQILQELPGIGTWAGRQRLFSIKPIENIPSSQDQVPLEAAVAEIDQLPSASTTAAEGGDGGGSEPLANGKNHNESTLESPVEPEEAVMNGNGGLGVYETPPNGYTTAPGQLRLARSGSNGSSEARHEAWRWRFSRKWEAEQRKVLEGNLGPDLPEDDLDPLEYVQACGVGMDLQMLEAQRRGGRGRGRGRSGTINAAAAQRSAAGGSGLNGLLSSGSIRKSDSYGGLRREASNVSSMTMQFDVDPSFRSVENLLSAEDSGNFSFMATPELSGTYASNPAAATRDLLSVACRGKELLQRQQEIEKEAAAVWEKIERDCSGGQTWAGNLLESVEIDTNGKFLFVVLKVSEPSGLGTGTASRQKLLVRGKHRSTPQELLQETIAQTGVVCSENQLPYVSVSIVGIGELEWRHDTDRHILVSPAPKGVVNVASTTSFGSYHPHGMTGGSPPDKTVDVCGLAASLLRQSLPCHFHVQTKTQSLAVSNGTYN